MGTEIRWRWIGDDRANSRSGRVEYEVWSGALADFLVLDRDIMDPYTCPNDDILDPRAEQVYLPRWRPKRVKIDVS